MNLRQKRKHFRYSLITFIVNTFGIESIDTPRKLRKYIKEKLKVNKTYGYTDSCYRYYFLESYDGAKPKFMRNKYNIDERDGRELDYVQY
nr:MAG TPA: hypothetical protein [Caudoviricetes sp.]